MFGGSASFSQKIATASVKSVLKSQGSGWGGAAELFHGKPVVGTKSGFQKVDKGFIKIDKGL